MIEGIVGHEAAKFTRTAKAEAFEIIRNILHGATGVASGKSPLSGIDDWAIEVARDLGFGDDQIFEFPADAWGWEFFRARNIKIAKKAGRVTSIVLAELAPTFTGNAWRDCYHCRLPAGDPERHYKSGGCWTAKYARKLGKIGRTIVIKGNA